MRTLRKPTAAAIALAMILPCPSVAHAAGQVVGTGKTSGSVSGPTVQINAVALPNLSGLQSFTMPTGLSSHLDLMNQAGAAAAAAQAKEVSRGVSAAAVPTTAVKLQNAAAASSHGAQTQLTTKIPAAAAAGDRTSRESGNNVHNAQSQLHVVAGQSQPVEGGSSGSNAGAAFDGLRLFLTAHGRDPIEARLEDLPAILAKDPAYAQALNKMGRVRLALAKKGGALTKESVPAIEAALKSYGVNLKISVETVPQQSRPAAVVADPSKPKAAGSWLERKVKAPFRELSYLASTLRASVTRPTTGEVIGGVVSKGPAFVLSVLWWAKLFLPLHPVSFAVAMAGSLALEIFHGIWINTWQNFQNIIGRQRGVNYQAAFNFSYMQATTIFFRTVTWLVIPATVMPWSWKFWSDIGAANVLGTFFGVIGFFGLNTLYDKGAISRGTRSWLQQGRDLFFLLAGTFLFSGSMKAFWTLWALQQTMDIVLYVMSRRAKARPAIYVAEAAVADSEGFKSLYPVNAGPEVSPVQAALGAVSNNPFVKPLLAPGLKGLERLGAGKWARRSFGALLAAGAALLFLGHFLPALVVLGAHQLTGLLLHLAGKRKEVKP